MIGQMAIVIGLLGFSDLGRSVTPTFLFRNRFYLPISTLFKMNKKSMWEVKKKFKISVHGTWNPVISFPDLLWTKPKARSGKVRKFAFLDWLLHLTYM